MGLIISRFRKKQSTKDILEKIQNDIISIEEYTQHTQARQKRLVGSLVLYSIILCLLSLVICYFYYLPTTLQDHLILAGAFFGFVLLVYILKRILTWWYRRKLSRNERKLEELKEKKEKILEQVMETETYKVAKEILEKYAPEQLRKNLYGKSPIATTPAGAAPRMPTPSSGTEIRRRLVPQTGPGNRGNQLTVRPAAPTGQQIAVPVSPNIQRAIVSPQLQGAPRPGGPSVGRIAASPNPSNTQHPSGPGSGPPTGPIPSGPPPPPGHPSALPPGHHAFVTHPLSRAGGVPPGPPMPRPVLPRERGYLDRFIEYLVGDGPANRFALVCRQCESHNGMALKEEFEYLAFRCAYCYYWNPARKQRPSAPRLETLVPPPPPPRLQMSQEEEEEEEENEESSSGEEEEEEGGQEEGSLEDMAKSGVSSENNSSSPSEDSAAEHRVAPPELLTTQTLNGPPSDITDSTSTSTTPSSPSEPDNTVQ